MPPKRKSKKRTRSKTASISDDALLSDEQLDELRTSFQAGLKKGQDTISIPQTKQALKRIAIDVKTDEVQQFLGQGLTDLDEELFIQFGAIKLIQIEKAQKAFNLFDKDHKGVVVLEDLQRVAQDLGEDLTNDELTEMIDLVDKSGDGLLSPKDFAKIAKKVNL